MRQAAHDLGNLFTLISGYRDLAEQDLARALERLVKLKEVERRAMDLVRAMMTPKTSSPAPPGVFDTNEVVKELVGLLDSGEMLGRDVRIHFVPWVAPLHVRGEGLALFRALLNICMNACNAMADKITLTTGVSAIRCLVTIEDNGSGIAPEKVESLWSPHVSADGAHGHGLAIVKETSEQLGGDISVTSTPGVGTKFALYLPLVTGTLAA